jgi:hypothetical protein
MALGSTKSLTEMSTRRGGRCIGLTTLPPSCANCLEIWEPQPLGTLRACPGLYRDSFTISPCKCVRHSSNGDLQACVIQPEMKKVQCDIYGDLCGQRIGFPMPYPTSGLLLSQKCSHVQAEVGVMHHPAG